MELYSFPTLTEQNQELSTFSSRVSNNESCTLTPDVVIHQPIDILRRQCGASDCWRSVSVPQSATLKGSETVGGKKFQCQETLTANYAN